MPMRSHLMRVSRTCAIAACAIGAAGCAILYGRARTEEMAVANAAMSDATGAGASQYAATDYRNAQRKLDRANDALAARDNEAARNLAEEAAADAKLAAGRAERARAACASSTDSPNSCANIRNGASASKASPTAWATRRRTRRFRKSVRRSRGSRSSTVESTRRASSHAASARATRWRAMAAASAGR